MPGTLPDATQTSKSSGAQLRQLSEQLSQWHALMTELQHQLACADANTVQQGQTPTL